MRLDRFYFLPRYPNDFDVGSPEDYITRHDVEGANGHETETWAAQ
jgi:hypothetical protein